MITIGGGARVQGPASDDYDYLPFEEGLKHAGLVVVDLFRACLSSNGPIVLAGHSFGVGALGFGILKAQSGNGAKGRPSERNLALRQASPATWRLAWR